MPRKKKISQKAPGYLRFRIILGGFFLVLVAGLVGRTVLAQSWSEPTQDPPNGNIAPPIWNQTSASQTASFWISGTGKFGSTISGTAQNKTLSVNDTATTDYANLAQFNAGQATARASFVLGNSSSGDWANNFLQLSVHGSSFANNYYLTNISKSNDAGWAYLWSQGSQVNGLGIFTYSAKPLALGTNNAAQLYIAANGNVGVGTTTPGILNGVDFGNNVRFNVYNAATSAYFSVDTGAAGAYAGLILNRSGASANQRMWVIDTQPYESNTNSLLAFSTYSDAGAPTAKLTILRNGRVGIGTSDPGFLLDSTETINGTSVSDYGVRGTGGAAASGGVYGASANASGYGVYGLNSNGGYAGYFSGNVEVTGDLTVGGVDVCLSNGTNCTAGGGITQGTLTWVSQYTGTTAALNKVTYGNGLYVAVANGTTIITSPDGVTWTTRTAPTSHNWNEVAYGNGIFVARSAGGEGGSYTAYSSDGISWSSGGSASVDTTSNNSLAFGAGLFVSLKKNGSNYTHAWTSPDGVTWTDRGSVGGSACSYYSVIHDMIYAGSKFVAVGSCLPNGSGTTQTAVFTSADGISWATPHYITGVTPYFTSITYGNNLYVVSFNNKATDSCAADAANYLYTSSTATSGSWTSNSTSISVINAINDVGYGNGLYVGVDGPATTRCSHFGVTSETATGPWTKQQSATDSGWNDVVYGSNKFVAVGAGGHVMTGAY